MKTASFAMAKPPASKALRLAACGSVAFDFLIGVVNVVTLGRYYSRETRRRR